MPSRTSSRRRRAVVSSGSESEDSVDGLISQRKGGRRASRRQSRKQEYAMRTLGHPHEQDQQVGQVGLHHLSEPRPRSPGFGRSEIARLGSGEQHAHNHSRRLSSTSSRQLAPPRPPPAAHLPHPRYGESSSGGENERRELDSEPSDLEAQQPAPRPSSRQSWHSGSTATAVEENGDAPPPRRSSSTRSSRTLRGPGPAPIRQRRAARLISPPVPRPRKWWQELLARTAGPLALVMLVAAFGCIIAFVAARQEHVALLWFGFAGILVFAFFLLFAIYNPAAPRTPVPTLTQSRCTSHSGQRLNPTFPTSLTAAPAAHPPSSRLYPQPSH
ncbi:hypothetical protein JCM10213_007449 [Rhodosporidiobolus nylandii]